MSTWIITKADSGQYTACIDGDDHEPVYSPEGVILDDENRELIEFIASSMNICGEDVCSGLSPYGAESSLYDFDLVQRSPDQIGALISAYDEARGPLPISRQEWEQLVTSCSPRTFAALMCLCGNIGLQPAVLDIALGHQAPSREWAVHVCGVRGYCEGNSSFILEAAESNPAFGKIILSDRKFASGCAQCISSDGSIDDQSCALRFQLGQLGEYIRLSEAAN